MTYVLRPGEISNPRHGRLATALARSTGCLALHDAFPPVENSQQRERAQIARAQVEELRRAVPMVSLTLPPGAPSGTVSMRDGVIIPEATLGIAIPVDPCEHLASADAPGGAHIEARVILGKGEQKELVLRLGEVQRATPAPPTPLILTAPPPPAAPPSAPPMQARLGGVVMAVLSRQVGQ